MALSDFLRNIQSSSEVSGFYNEGIFNVETSKASFRTFWLPSCDCNLIEKKALQYECSKCGKTNSNNFSIKTGDGDGLYSLVTFSNANGQILAAACLFDSNSELAQDFMSQTEAGTINSFNPLPTLFQADYLGLEAGSLDLDNRANAVFVSDASSGLDSSCATLWTKNWVPGRVRVYSFVEDSLESDMAQTAVALGSKKESFNGGLDTSVRPRAIVLISDKYPNLMKNLADLKFSPSEWESQIDAWSQQVVVSNVGEKSSLAFYWNGRRENEAMVEAMVQADRLEEARDHALREFSWYLQGSTFGDQDCRETAAAIIEESNGELNDPMLLRYAYHLRGLKSKASAVR